MITMTHRSMKHGPMVIKTESTRCGCTWDIKVDAETRMGPPPQRDENGVRFRVKPMRKPRDWYRVAENILLTTGKVHLQQQKIMGQDVTVLVCKEHKR